MIGALNEQMIEEVLQRNIVGRLGYQDREKMFIIPVHYLYFSGKYIIIHSRKGEKIDILRKNPRVCFEVDEIDNIHNHRGVLLWGKYEELNHPRERFYALDLLLRKIHKHQVMEAEVSGSPLKIEEDLLLPDKEKEIVYRIKIEEKTGRFEKTED